MARKLTILFIPVPAVGHVNASVGVAQALVDAGHRCVFHVTDNWNGKLNKYGIELLTYPMDSDDELAKTNPAAYTAKIVKGLGMMNSLPALDKMLNFAKSMSGSLQNNDELDRRVAGVLAQVKPDVIIIDQITSLPSVEKSGIPWVFVCSTNPLLHIDNVDLPPPGLGLSVYGDREEWNRCRQALNEANRESRLKFNEYLTSHGLPTLQTNTNFFINDSPYLNLYGFPKELDYDLSRPKWHRLDNLMRIDKQDKFVIPEQLRNKPGKLVFFSLGSMACTEIELMKRLIGFLAQSKHRFIVSKGPYHDQFELADNMWGEESVPQTRVLPEVDLVITHGGNNTLCETFYYGKPIIVMPMFNDQMDNAQRLQDTGLGVRLDLYRCTRDELLGAIDKLLADNHLNEKLKNISMRIQSENSMNRVPKLIENLVQT